MPQPKEDCRAGRGEYEERELSRLQCSERAAIAQTESVDWSRDSLTSYGFHGWIPFGSLARGDLPESPGVYVVYRDEHASPEFLAQSPAGTHKGRDLTAPLELVEAAWLDSSPVLYIGKATSLRSRVTAYRRQGQGRKAGHQGGAYLWQLVGATEALVAWKETPSFACAEAALIEQFMSDFGARPFANRKHEPRTSCPPDALERFLSA